MIRIAIFTKLTGPSGILFRSCTNSGLSKFVVRLLLLLVDGGNAGIGGKGIDGVAGGGEAHGGTI